MTLDGRQLTPTERLALHRELETTDERTAEYRCPSTLLAPSPAPLPLTLIPTQVAVDDEDPDECDAPQCLYRRYAEQVALVHGLAQEVAE
jgi:hypothetical protein